MNFKDSLKLILDNWGVEVKSWDLYRSAFTHSSYLNENISHEIKSYERLEFLGDSVLDLFLSKYLYQKYLDKNEGDLSKLRSYLNRSEILSEISLNLGLKELIFFGKGEEISSRGKEKICGDVLESFIAVIYLENGFKVIEKVLIKVYENYFLNIHNLDIVDYKTKIQEIFHKMEKKTPTYHLDNEEKTNSGSVFSVSLWVGDKKIAVAKERTKKKAQLLCAKYAFLEYGDKNG